MFLALAERFLGPFAAGCIAAAGVNHLFIWRRSGRPLYPAIDPVRAAGPNFVGDDRGSGRGSVFEALEFGDGVGAILRMDQIEIRFDQ